MSPPFFCFFVAFGACGRKIAGGRSPGLQRALIRSRGFNKHREGGGVGEEEGEGLEGGAVNPPSFVGRFGRNVSSPVNLHLFHTIHADAHDTGGQER